MSSPSDGRVHRLLFGQVMKQVVQAEQSLRLFKHKCGWPCGVRHGANVPTSCSPLRHQMASVAVLFYVSGQLPRTADAGGLDLSRRPHGYHSHRRLPDATRCCITFPFVTDEKEEKYNDMLKPQLQGESKCVGTNTDPLFPSWLMQCPFKGSTPASKVSAW